MEKVKLTREQAEAIGDVISYGTKENVIESHIEEGWSIKEYLCLNALSTDEIIKALYIGYEIEETFKVGDWLHLHLNNEDIVREYYSSSHMKEHHFYKNLEGHPRPFSVDKYIRHATPEEIGEEKQRRWWAKHGREVWELREGDCLISKYDKHTCQVKFVEASDEVSVLLVDGIQDEFYEGEHDLQILRDSYKVFCFSEDRKDVQA